MTEELLIKTLLDARIRLVVSVCTVVRNVHTAEDIYQDLLVKALRMKESFADEGGLLAWARVSARNLGIDYLRREGRMGEILSELATAAIEEKLEDSAERLQRRIEAMRICLENLPKDSKALLWMRYDEARKCSELSKLLHRSETAIYKTLSRLHQSLRKCIDDRLTAQEVV